MPPVWLRYTQKTVIPTISADLDTKVKSARRALDAWVREIVSWHFDPVTGCPFWLDYAKRLDWDPRREIRSYDDLDRFDFHIDPDRFYGRLCFRAGSIPEFQLGRLHGLSRPWGDLYLRVQRFRTDDGQSGLSECDRRHGLER